MLKWAGTLFKKALPDFILRSFWSNQQLLQAIEAFHFDQAPRFFVRAERSMHELQTVGFNVFNFSPFKLTIVGADLEIVIDGQGWLTYRQRLPTEIPMAPYARSGFHVPLTLSESQVERLRKYPNEWASIRVRGGMIVKCIFGELRKDIHSDVIALIDRDPRP